MSAPKEALALISRCGRDTVTTGDWRSDVCSADLLEIVGTTGKVTVALAVVPSAKLAVTVRLAPLLNGVGVKSDANTKKRSEERRVGKECRSRGLRSEE